MFTCEVCGREINSRYTVGGKFTALCKKHVDQYKRFGKFLDNNPRTIYDPNEYHIIGNITYIDLYDNKCNIVGQAKIDTEDIDKVDKYKWRTNWSNYVVTSDANSNGTLFMHRIILGIDSPVDHINHDTLDNRKINLRPITKSHNQMNANFKGVTTNKRNGKFVPHIKINQVNLVFHQFENENEALLCRWYAEAILFREFRYPKPKPVVPKSKEQEIFDFAAYKIFRFLPVYFVSNSGVKCFVDDNWHPFTVDLNGVLRMVNYCDGLYYYNDNPLTPVFCDATTGEVIM